MTVVDERTNKLMKGFAANAGYFEQHAPWESKYKLEKPHPPVANAVEALIETADFEVNTIGENLPNEAEIHDKYGSKSFIFTGSTRAFSSARGNRVAQEFAYSPEELERARKYQNVAEDLFTSMHEVIGHGSGKMNPKLTKEPAFYIKEYYSTLEESRADLMALWNFFDSKLIEVGAMPNLDVAKAAYDGEARAALSSYVRFRRAIRLRRTIAGEPSSSSTSSVKRRAPSSPLSATARYTWWSKTTTRCGRASVCYSRS